MDVVFVQMVSPVKKMSMKGEVKSVEPYSVSLTNSYDDMDAIQADFTLDTNKRSFILKTNYDLGEPWNPPCIIWKQLCMHYNIMYSECGSFQR